MSSDAPAPTLLDRLLNLLDRLAIAFRLLILIVLILTTLGLATLGIWKVVSLNRVHHLVFAVGDPTGESYILGQAIAQVVETFNEAYKTAREKIEREIEVREQRSLETQQARTADYMNDLLLLIQNRTSYSNDALQTDLDRIFKPPLMI